MTTSGRKDDFEVKTEAGDSFVNFKSIHHNTEEQNMEAHNWNYFSILSFSKKNVGFTVTLQSKHQYLQSESNLLSLLDGIFVYH